MGTPFPADATLEGVYIDDHFVLGIVDECVMDAAEGEDLERILRSHEAYQSAGIGRADEKAFGFARELSPGQPRRADRTFVVLGTEVRSDPGTAGTTPVKRCELMILIAWLLNLEGSSKNVLRRSLALYTHTPLHA